MDKYEVVLYPRAVRDLDDIFTYISSDKLAPEIARKQTEKLQRKIGSLGVFPEAHQTRLTGRFAGKGYKQLIIDNYIAIYRIDKKNKTVYVVTIQYHGRNL